MSESTREIELKWKVVGDVIGFQSTTKEIVEMYAGDYGYAKPSDGKALERDLLLHHFINSVPDCDWKPEMIKFMITLADSTVAKFSPQCGQGGLDEKQALDLILSYHEFTGIPFPTDSKPLEFVKQAKFSPRGVEDGKALDLLREEISYLIWNGSMKGVGFYSINAEKADEIAGEIIAKFSPRGLRLPTITQIQRCGVGLNTALKINDLIKSLNAPTTKEKV